MSDVFMPQLGETVAEGKILQWFKTDGDEVAIGDALFEVETDKVTMEVEAIVAGRLDRILIRAGESAKVGAVVASIGSGRAIASDPMPSAASGPVQHSSDTVLDPFCEVRTAIGHFGPANAGDDVRVSPLARRIAAQNGVDLTQLARSVAAAGGRRIWERDVRKIITAPAEARPVDKLPQQPVETSRAAGPAPAAALPQGADVLPLNAIRRRTGERLAENWRTIPHVFQGIEVDFSIVEAARTKHKESFRATHGAALTYLPFIARATCLALRTFPQVNARLDGDNLVLLPDVNLGIAVDLSHEGLVVPVIRNADELTVPGLAKSIGRAVEKARSSRLTADELSGGTYSITNNGSFGTMFTAPIINAPQVAILSTDAIRMKPAVVETSAGTFIAPRPLGVVAQSFDHRAFDGAYSAAFLSFLKTQLETRDWLGEFQ
jgi:pyruvate/2-oxoglutarate dehydrogenase complex dihydrolipoamide acyltransferase (E2) component